MIVPSAGRAATAAVALLLVSMPGLGADHASSVSEANRNLFISWWGDLWDPDAVGTHGVGADAEAITMAQAADLFVARAGSHDWSALLEERATDGGDDVNETVVGKFELVEVWGGFIWDPQPENCSRGSGSGGHYDTAHHQYHPLLAEQGFHPYYGNANSSVSATPGPGFTYAHFIDHGATSSSFDYQSRRVDYGGNSDFWCERFGFFAFELVVNNPRVTGFVHFT